MASNKLVCYYYQSDVTQFLFLPEPSAIMIPNLQQVPQVCDTLSLSPAEPKVKQESISHLFQPLKAMPFTSQLQTCLISDDPMPSPHLLEEFHVTTTKILG